MKRIILIIALVIFSMLLNGQSFIKYERFVDDGHVWHNCINAFETSDGNIIMIEECCDTITDYSGVYTESVNLLKINPQGILIDSTKVSFSATSLYGPLLRNPSEINNNVMSGLYLNDNDELHYTAVFFDDNLSIINTIDVDFPVEGFTTSYKSMIDNDGNLILVSKKKDTEDTYIFVKINVYGEIITVKHSVSESYQGLYFNEKSLYIHSTDPLQYGCYFEHNGGGMTIFILDEGFDIVDMFNLDYFTIDGQRYTFQCGDSEIIHLKDGNILMSSIVSATSGWSNEIGEHLQLTKFNKEYEIIDYERVAFRPIYSDGGHFYINSCKSIVEDDEGNIYLIWRNVGNKVTVSFLNGDLDLIWGSALDTDGYNVCFLYGAFILNNDKLVVYGDYINDIGYFGVCNIISNDYVAINDQIPFRPYSFYPNPANDKINIRFSPDTKCEKVEIYGIDGKLYHTQNFSLNSINIDELSNGIYMMKVTLENGNVFTEKIAVK